MRSLRIVFVVWMLVGCGSVYSYQTLRPLDQPQPTPKLYLLSHTGQQWSWQTYHGNVVALFFGFTQCPDVCPTTLSDLKEVKRRLGNVGDRFQVAMVTVEPLHDTPQKLAEYMALFDPTWVGLTGPQSLIAQAERDYGVAVLRDTSELSHSAAVYIIDPQGRLFGTWRQGEPLDKFVDDLRHLIN